MPCLSEPEAAIRHSLLNISYCRKILICTPQPSALKLIQDRKFERNVRELRNIFSRAAVLCATNLIDLPIIQGCFNLDQTATDITTRGGVVESVDETIMHHQQCYLKN